MCTRFQKRAPSAELYKYRGNSFAAIGKLDEARADYETAAKMMGFNETSTKGNVERLLCLALFTFGNHDEAVASEKDTTIFINIIRLVERVPADRFSPSNKFTPYASK